MSDIKLFRTANGKVTELEGKSVALEKSLQGLIEKHLDSFLGVTFLATEYSTGKTHGGRIDTLGVDENGCPVIIEYKRAVNENVINQGLYYLDWLLDHKAEFKLLVLDKLGKEKADAIEWSSPRLLCIAGDFTKYDEHAVQQINRNIELIRYRRYADELLLFELVNASSATISSATIESNEGPPGGGATTYKTVSEQLQDAPTELRDIFDAIKSYLMGLGDDVQVKPLKLYFAFKRIKNFACIEFRNKSGHVLVYLKVDPTNVDLEDGFTRDVREVGHYGTGDLEVVLSSLDDFEKAKPLFLMSYEAN